MEDYIKKAIETYQCPGCGCGSDISCYKKGYYLECASHVVVTTISCIGRVLLGMPKGFDRLGHCDKTKITIFENFEDGWGYNMYNIPVWKYLDRNGNTLIRGISPRTNYPWIHIFIGNHTAKISCLEITQKNVDEMD